jgi:asparagine synthase (glutamine-hydrolysing)
MCGITGFAGRGDQVVLDRMTDILEHRGPDARGTWLKNESPPDLTVGLGFRRLSIIDLSSAGNQPMCTADGRFWIVFNGEIYNFAELRRELEAAGCQFRSRTDTEALLYGYAVWGEAVLKRLNGIFAFAVWDTKEKELFAARDRLGIKPFYYTQHDGTFLFASEIKSLLQYPGLPRRISPAGLDQFLSFLWVPDPNTMLEGIHKLPSGHALRWSAGRLVIREWWDCAHLAGGPGEGTLEDCTAQVRRQLEISVQRQLVSDVPLGAFLSGGIDSSAVVAMMAGHERKPSTYTVGFTAEDLSYEIVADDVRYSRQMAGAFPLDYHEIILNPQVVSLLPQVVWHMDEPVADPAAISAYLICQAARKTLTVMLNGQGGDEVFAGYPRHLAVNYARLYNRLPALVRRAIRPLLGQMRAAATGRRSTWVRNFKKFTRGAELPFHERYLSYLTHFHSAEKLALYAPGFRRQLDGLDPYAAHRDHLARVEGADPVAQMCYLDLKTFLPSLNLTYTDKMSMAHGVEVRVPFLDHELVELALRIPARYKVRGRTSKYVLKKAMNGLLPHEIIWRRKAGFTAPIRSWLQKDLKPMIDDWLAPDVIRERGLFDPGAVQRLLAEYRSGREDNSWKIWQLLTLELWTRTFIDADGSTPVGTGDVAHLISPGNLGPVGAGR